MSNPELTESREVLNLTFDWKESRFRQRLHLLFFVGIAFLIHAVCFYVFQVVYPSSTRGLPMPKRLVILNPDNPAAIEAIREVEDRLAGYGLGPGDRAETVSLSAFTLYEPSFAGYQPGLRDLPMSSLAQLPLPRSLEETTLPPVRIPIPVMPAEHAEDPAEPLVLIDGPLAARKVTDPALHRKLSSHFAENHGTLCTFSIGVNAAGVIAYCFPDEEDFRVENLEQLQRTLMELRFTPVPDSGNEITWGTLTVEW